MKRTNTLKKWTLVAISVVVFGIVSTNAYSQESAPCPFADDAVIFYGSPHLFGEACGAAARKCDFSDEIKALDVWREKEFQICLSEKKAEEEREKKEEEEKSKKESEDLKDAEAEEIKS